MEINNNNHTKVEERLYDAILTYIHQNKQQIENNEKQLESLEKRLVFLQQTQNKRIAWLAKSFLSLQSQCEADSKLARRNLRCGFATKVNQNHSFSSGNLSEDLLESNKPSFPGDISCQQVKSRSNSDQSSCRRTSKIKTAPFHHSHINLAQGESGSSEELDNLMVSFRKSKENGSVFSNVDSKVQSDSPSNESRRLVIFQQKESEFPLSAANDESIKENSEDESKLLDASASGAKKHWEESDKAVYSGHEFASKNKALEPSVKKSQVRKQSRAMTTHCAGDGFYPSTSFFRPESLSKGLEEQNFENNKTPEKKTENFFNKIRHRLTEKKRKANIKVEASKSPHFLELEVALDTGDVKVIEKDKGLQKVNPTRFHEQQRLRLDSTGNGIDSRRSTDASDIAPADRPFVSPGFKNPSVSMNLPFRFLSSNLVDRSKPLPIPNVVNRPLHCVDKSATPLSSAERSVENSSAMVSNVLYHTFTPPLEEACQNENPYSSVDELSDIVTATDR